MRSCPTFLCENVTQISRTLSVDTLFILIVWNATRFLQHFLHVWTAVDFLQLFSGTVPFNFVWLSHKFPAIVSLCFFLSLALPLSSVDWHTLRVIEIRKFDAPGEKSNERSKWENQLGSLRGSMSPPMRSGAKPQKIFAIVLFLHSI